MGGTGTTETDTAPDGQVAEIRLAGMIQSGGGFSTDGTTPDGFSQLLDQARQDGSEGYLIVINSPGGSVVASKDITRAIEDLDGPVACLMKDTAASGAYWAATACDEIVADSLTLTGSIGVTSTYMEFSGLLNRLGIEYVNITAGELKDIGSPLKNMTEEERELLQSQLDTIHASFIEQARTRGRAGRYPGQP
jgi:protease-4